MVGNQQGNIAPSLEPRTTFELITSIVEISTQLIEAPITAGDTEASEPMANPCNCLPKLPMLVKTERE